MERLASPNASRGGTLFHDFVEAESSAADSPRRSGIRRYSSVHNNFFQVFLVTQRNHRIACGICRQIADIVSGLFDFNIRFFRNCHIGLFVRNHHLSHRQRRQFYSYLIAGNIVLYIQNLNITAVLCDSINNGTLIVSVCAFQRNNRFLCIFLILVGNHCSHFTVIRAINCRKDCCLRQVSRGGLHKSISKCTAVAVIVGVKIDRTGHIRTKRKRSPIGCQIYALIGKSPQRFSFCNGRNYRFSSCRFLADVCQIVLRQCQLGTRIVLVNRLLHSGEERERTPKPLCQPAVFLVIRIVQASRRLQNAVICFAVLCIVVNINHI